VEELRGSEVVVDERSRQWFKASGFKAVADARGRGVALLEDPDDVTESSRAAACRGLLGLCDTSVQAVFPPS